MTRTEVDADALRDRDPEDSCNAESSGGWTCSRSRHHSGDHAAGDGREVLFRWPQAEKQRREIRACVDCGYKRKVAIHDHGAWIDGQTHEPKLYWSKRCTACELLHRAAIKEQEAARFRAKAAAIRARRPKGAHS